MIKQIDMTGDTFKGLKDTMTLHLKDVLRKMERYGTDKGSVSVKIDVAFLHTQEGIMPTFVYKVSDDVAIRDESKGSMGGCFLDESEDGFHQLSFLEDNQTSMFEGEVE